MHQCIDVDIPFLQSYNNERHHANFLKELHECCICYGEYPGTEFVQLPCKHFFCRKCLQTFAQIHVTEGTIGNLQCLDAKCTIMIPPGLLQLLLNDENYERWEAMMLEKTLASMSDVVYCPRCETPCIEDEEQHAQCPTCFFSFCTLCRERCHVGIACMALDMKLQILQDRQNSSQINGDQKCVELEKINEMLSMKEIHREQYFCYRCNKAIDASNPYGHFMDGSCELFPREMVEGWQERINHRQVVGQIQAELFHLRGSTCPSCRQFNAKITERLRDPRGGLGRGALSACALRTNGLRQRPFLRPGGDRNDSEDHPPAKRRLSSAVVKVDDGELLEDADAEQNLKTKDSAGEGVNGTAAVSQSDRNPFTSNQSGWSGRDGNQRTSKGVNT